MMTKRCNKIGFNAMNNVAMTAFCAISGGGGTSKPRPLARRLSSQSESFAASFEKEGGVIRLYSSIVPSVGTGPMAHRAWLGTVPMVGSVHRTGRRLSQRPARARLHARINSFTTNHSN